MMKARIYTEKKDLDDFLRHPASADSTKASTMLFFRSVLPIALSRQH